MSSARPRRARRSHPAQRARATAAARGGAHAARSASGNASGACASTVRVLAPRSVPTRYYCGRSGIGTWSSEWRGVGISRVRTVRCDATEPGRPRLPPLLEDLVMVVPVRPSPRSAMAVLGRICVLIALSSAPARTQRQRRPGSSPRPRPRPPFPSPPPPQLAAPPPGSLRLRAADPQDAKGHACRRSRPSLLKEARTHPRTCAPAGPDASRPPCGAAARASSAPPPPPLLWLAAGNHTMRFGVGVLRAYVRHALCSLSCDGTSVQNFGRRTVNKDISHMVQYYKAPLAALRACAGMLAWATAAYPRAGCARTISVSGLPPGSPLAWPSPPRRARRVWASPTRRRDS